MTLNGRNVTLAEINNISPSLNSFRIKIRAKYKLVAVSVNKIRVNSLYIERIARSSLRQHGSCLVSCLNSDNNIVKFTSTYSIYFARMYSLLGRNAQFCCSRYNELLSQLQEISKTCIWRHVTSCYSQDVRDRANVISELLSVNSCCMELSILSDVEMDLCVFFLYFSFFIFNNLFMCTIVRISL